MKTFGSILVFALVSLISSGQSTEIDSMKQRLLHQSGVKRLNTLLNLSYQLFDYNIEAAHQYAQEAYTEAQNNKNKPGEKHALTLIGEYYYNLTDLSKARYFLKKPIKSA